MTTPTQTSQVTADSTLLHACLTTITQAGGSDLHIRPGEPPMMRLHGHLEPVPGFERLSADDLESMMLHMTERTQRRRAEFKENGEADLSYELEGVARFRVNMFRERGKTAMTLRVIPTDVPELGKLGVPQVIADLALSGHGLVLVTGATGSGKTTTLAAMIDHINRNTQKHILTIEDPIEIVHPNRRSLVSQREVGSDTGDFGQALRRALRQDPDVILIGEIRDEETMRTALAAAETGHLVFATLHTINCSESIARVLDLFPSDAEKQARAMLAGALQGIVSQRLARTVDGGRVAVVEVMLNTSRVKDCILNEEDTPKIPEAIAEGGYYGMQSFDQALIRLVISGRITEQEALHHVSSPQNFKLALESATLQAVVDAEREAAIAVQREAEAVAMAAHQAQLDEHAAAQEAAAAAAAAHAAEAEARAAAAEAALAAPPVEPAGAPVPGGPPEVPAAPAAIPVPGAAAPVPGAAPLPGAAPTPLPTPAAATAAPLPTAAPTPPPPVAEVAAPMPPPPAVTEVAAAPPPPPAAVAAAPVPTAEAAAPPPPPPPAAVEAPAA